MTRPYLLWLIWQNTKTRNRYHVGNLIYKDNLYIFQYENFKTHRGLQEAIEDGYSPHLAFPDFNKVYISHKLFGPFLRRLPNPGRPDYKRLLRKYGITSDLNDMDILRVTGGRLATDSYEFVKPIYVEEDYFDFDFHIAGWRHHNGEEQLKTLSLGSQLILEKEPTNPYDPYAVMVKSIDNNLLGYVPAFYSEFVTSVLDNNFDFKLNIETIDVDAIPQHKVKVRINGQFNKFNSSYPEQLEPVEYLV